MLIRNVSAMLGPRLEYVDSVCARIEDGKFVEISQSLRPRVHDDIIDCQGMLLVPGFVNCHTHVGDSVAKDISLGRGLDDSVHPAYGVKSKILNAASPDHLVDFMRATCKGMLSRGITTFADFREGGAEGVRLLQKACRDIPIRAVILGRPNTGNTPDTDIQNVLSQCDGMGISGANENTDHTLTNYSRMHKIRAIHAAESPDTVQKSRDMTGRGEVERALQMKPRFLVHMGAATDSELRSIPQGTGIVVCPRCNAVLTGMIPDIPRMASHDITLGLGTDNVMVNHPDMFREMDFAWKATRCSLSPLQVLRMATVNGGHILGMRVGVIDRGAAADFILIEKHHIDLEPMHRPHAALVHRASPESIRAVSVGGRIVHGRI